MDLPETRSVHAGFWAVVLVGILAWAPTTYPGYWQGLEGFVPVFNATTPGPIASVATDPDLWRGTGSGAFLLAQPMLLLGMTATAAVRATLGLTFVLGGLGIYTWLNALIGDRAAGLAGLIYMFSPLLLATVYVRGSLGDAMVMGLLPLALAGAAAYGTGRSPMGAAILIVSLLWIWRSQAGLAVFASLLLLFYALLVQRQTMTALIIALTAGAGLASLIPWWQLQAPPPVRFHDHYVHVFQLLDNRWEVASSVAGWQDAYPFQLGWSALALSGITFWLWRMRYGLLPHKQHARLLTFAFGGVLLLVLSSLSLAEPLWRVSASERLLSYPWQILLLSAPLLTVTGASLATWKGLAAPHYWLGLIALVVLGSYGYLTTEFTTLTPPRQPVAVLGGQNNIVLLEAKLDEATDHSAATLDVTWQVLHPLAVDYNIFWQALIGEGDTTAVVSQLDTQPLEGLRPATSWRPGEILTDSYRLDLSSLAETDAGPAENGLHYVFGFYDWRDGSRLPVDGGRDDKLLFPSNEVSRPDDR